jgi:hypothetical protein
MLAGAACRRNMPLLAAAHLHLPQRLDQRSQRRRPVLAPHHQLGNHGVVVDAHLSGGAASPRQQGGAQLAQHPAPGARLACPAPGSALQEL